MSGLNSRVVLVAPEVDRVEELSPVNAWLGQVDGGERAVRDDGAGVKEAAEGVRDLEVKVGCCKLL